MNTRSDFLEECIGLTEKYKNSFIAKKSEAILASELREIVRQYLSLNEKDRQDFYAYINEKIRLISWQTMPKKTMGKAGLFGAIALPIADALLSETTTLSRVAIHAIAGGALGAASVSGIDNANLPRDLLAYRIVADKISKTMVNIMADKSHSQNSNHGLRQRLPV